MPYFILNLQSLSFNDNNEHSLTWQDLLISVKRLPDNRLYDLTLPSQVSTIAAYNSDPKCDAVLLIRCAQGNPVPLSQMAAGRAEVKIS